jgi:hypothetical protein
VPLGAVLLVAALLGAACGGATGSGTPGGSTGGSTPAANPVTLTDADNGRTVTVGPGGRVDIVLASTYWTIAPLADGTVLRTDRPPTTTPRPGQCVPGEGCGTVTADYRAVSSGTVTLTASRVACGEALACPPSQRTFRVVVTVR